MIGDEICIANDAQKKQDKGGEWKGSTMANLNPFQDRDILVPLSDPWDAQSQIIVLDEHGSLRFHKTLGDTFETMGAPPNPGDVYIRPRWRTEGYAAIARVENVVARAIDAAGGNIKLDDALASISAMGFNSTEAEGLLRYLVSRGDFPALIKGKRKPSVRLSLSANARTRENHRSYAASFAHELAQQAEQLGWLIGHGPTLGSEREELLRALLERHVPRRFHVATGFIEGSDRQIDILIYDQIDFAPVFCAGNLVVVPIEAARALIEVKSMLSAGELSDALQHLDEAIGIRTAGPPIFRGVFGYRGAKAATLVDAMIEHHRELTDEDWDGAPVGSIYEMVDAVCVLRSTALMTGFFRSDWRGTLAWTPAIAEQVSEAGRDIQATLFYARLMRYLRHPFEGGFGQPGLGSAIAADVENAQVTELYPGRNWGAYVIDDGIERLESQIEGYHDWLAGKAWREPPPL